MEIGRAPWELREGACRVWHVWNRVTGAGRCGLQGQQDEYRPLGLRDMVLGGFQWTSLAVRKSQGAR